MIKENSTKPIKCYDNIPIKIKEKYWFLDIATMSVHQQGIQRPCHQKSKDLIIQDSTNKSWLLTDDGRWKLLKSQPRQYHALILERFKDINTKLAYYDNLKLPQVKEMELQQDNTATTNIETKTDIKTAHQVKGLKNLLNEAEKTANKASGIFKGTGGAIARDIITLIVPPLAVIAILLCIFKAIRRRIFNKKKPTLSRIIVSRNRARNKSGNESERETAL